MPGGGVVAAQIHVARTTCRRAERRVVGLVGEGECEAEAGRYLNRLSDFLFNISRVTSRLENKAETIYIPTSNLHVGSAPFREITHLLMCALSDWKMAPDGC